MSDVSTEEDHYVVTVEISKVTFVAPAGPTMRGLAGPAKKERAVNDTLRVIVREKDLDDAVAKAMKVLGLEVTE